MPRPTDESLCNARDKQTEKSAKSSQLILSSLLSRRENKARRIDAVLQNSQIFLRFGSTLTAYLILSRYSPGFCSRDFAKSFLILIRWPPVLFVRDIFANSDPVFTGSLCARFRGIDHQLNSSSVEAAYCCACVIACSTSVLEIFFMFAVGDRYVDRSGREPGKFAIAVAHPFCDKIVRSLASKISVGWALNQTLVNIFRRDY